MCAASGLDRWIAISTFNLINQDIDSVLDGELHSSKGLIMLLLPWAIHNRQTGRYHRNITDANFQALSLNGCYHYISFHFIVCLQ